MRDEVRDNGEFLLRVRELEEDNAALQEEADRCRGHVGALRDSLESLQEEVTTL